MQKSILREQSPVLTIGMPVYNRERFIGQAIDSLIRQSFKDFVILISDNCSTDNTPIICRKYASLDNRVKYFRQSKNIGMVENFQFVLDICETKYFMWAASDDLWSPNWIDELIKTISPGYCAIGLVKYIDLQGEPIHGPALSLRFDSPIQILRRIKFLWVRNPFLVYGLFNSKDIKLDWRPILGTYERGYFNYRHNGDIYLCYSILKNLRVSLSNTCTRYNRIHPENSKNLNSYPEKVVGLGITLRRYLTPIDLVIVSKISNGLELTLGSLIYLALFTKNIFSLFAAIAKRILNR